MGKNTKANDNKDDFDSIEQKNLFPQKIQKDSTSNKTKKSKPLKKKDKTTQEKAPQKKEKKIQKNAAKKSQSDPSQESYMFNQGQDISGYLYQGSQQDQNGSNQPNNDSDEPQQNTNNQLEGSMEDYILLILSQFFTSIEQQHGLVFKQNERKQIKKKNQHLKKEMDDQHQLFPGDIRELQKIKNNPPLKRDELNQLLKRNEELLKIQKFVPSQLQIFKKSNHKIQFNKQEYQRNLAQDIKKMMNLFKSSCSIFCREVTNELYQILTNLCNIVVEFRNQSQAVIQKKLGQFGDKIPSQQGNNKKYFFFGYHFLTLNKKLTKEEIEKQEQKKSKNHILKRKYRRAGGQYSKFAKKAGLFIQKQLKQLKSYSYLK